MIRVMIVDDQALVRAGFAMLVRSQPDLAVVAECVDGVHCLETLDRLEASADGAGAVDIILMDVRMPELDGVEAARHILAERQVPIVMVTAFAERDIVQQASEAGAFGYLVKPFRQDDVLAAITTAQARSTELADARKEAKSLSEALETRKVVERAKGMLMTAENISEPDAYARMRSASQRTGQPMKAIAEALLATLSGEK